MIKKHEGLFEQIRTNYFLLTNTKQLLFSDTIFHITEILREGSTGMTKPSI